MLGRKKPKKPKPAKEINIFVNYKDSVIFGADYIVEGLEWTIEDGLHNLLASGTTDATGMITFAIKGSYDLSNYGIHLHYTWQSIPYELRNLEAGAYEVGLDTFQLVSDMFWSDDLTPAQLGTVEVWFGGANIVNVTLIGVDLNRLDYSVGLVSGTYTIKADNMNDEMITIGTTQTYNSDILVSAEGCSISELKRGFILFFSLIRIISIQVRKVKSFPLFLSTIIYNEIKTSYSLFHYYPLDFCLLVILPLTLQLNRNIR